jgi:hypothetical protein
MSRLDRLKEYSKPMTSGDAPHGAASSKENLADWSARASENSKDRTTRAKGPILGGPQGTHGEDPPMLPSTKVTVRDTAMKPKVSRKIDSAMAGKGDLNHVGGSYLPNVRRDG